MRKRAPLQKPPEPRDPFFWGYLLFLIWLPIPLGSNRPLAWAASEVVLFLGLAAWLVFGRKSQWSPSQAFVMSKPVIIALLLWWGFTLVQAIPAPGGVISLLSPASFALYDGTNAIPSISVDRNATLQESHQIAALIVLFILTFALVDSPRKLSFVLTTILFVGVGEATYGLVMNITGIEYVLWFPKEAYRGFVTGTYINRNHFAGLMEMSIPIGFSLWINYTSGAERAPTIIRRVIGSLVSLLESSGRIFIYLVIMFGALFMSGSRAGVTSLIISAGLVALVTITFQTSARARNRTLATVIAATLAIPLVAIFWFDSGMLINRFTNSANDIGGRIVAWRGALRIIAEYPLFGAGAGSFDALLPVYEVVNTHLRFDHAHNDYLELLTEYGFIGALPLVFAVVYMLALIIKGINTQTNISLRSISIGCLAGIGALLVHAIFDFNFQIFANAAYWTILLALALIAATMGKYPLKSDDGQGK